MPIHSGHRLHRFHSLHRLARPFSKRLHAATARLLVLCSLDALLASPALAQGMSPATKADMQEIFAHYLQEHRLAASLGVVLLGVACLASVHFFLVNARRRRQAVLLQGARARLKAVLDAMPDAAFVLDDSGRVVEVLNDASALFTLPATAQTTHARPPLGQGRYLEELLPMDCATLLAGASRVTMGGGGVQEVVFALRGEWYECRLAPLRATLQPDDAATRGARDEAVCVVRNITLRKNMEQSLQAATRETEAMNSRLLELDQLKTDLIHAVSQEIRMPLTSIFGFVVLVRKEFQRRIAAVVREAATRKPKEEAAVLDAASSRILDNLRIVQEEGVRLSHLVDDLLDLSLLESGKNEWRDEMLTLADVVDSSLASLQGRLAEAERVRVRVDLAPTLLPLYMDRTRLQQVVANLLDNALRATQEGIIHVTGRLLGSGMLELAVEDAGPGIPAEVLPRVFDKFHHLSTADPSLRRQDRGSGLGLAICRNIVKHYAGNIQAISPPGPDKHGTRMVVQLPAAPVVLPPGGAGGTGGAGGMGGNAPRPDASHG